MPNDITVGGPSMPLFDLARARDERDKGKKVAADNKPYKLLLAKMAVRYAAMRTETFTASSDDAYAVCERLYSLQDGWLGKSAGSIFDGKMWERGEPIQSHRTLSHGRWIFRWILRPEYRHDVTMPPAEEVHSLIASE